MLNIASKSVFFGGKSYLLTGRYPKLSMNFGSRRKSKSGTFRANFGEFRGEKGPSEFVNSVAFEGSPINEIDMNVEYCMRNYNDELT